MVVVTARELIARRKLAIFSTKNCLKQEARATPLDYSATELVQIATQQYCIGDAEHCFDIVSSFTYNDAEVTDLRTSEFSATSVTKRLSVDSQSCLSPSTFGATEVTFRTGQYFRMPRCPRTNSGDACDDRCVLVDDGLDSAVVVVDGRNSGFGSHGECFTDLSRENSLVNRCEFSVTHSAFRTLGLHDVEFTLDHVVICEQSSWAYWRREQT